MEEEYYTIADFQTTIPDGISFQAGMKVEVSLLSSLLASCHQNSACDYLCGHHTAGARETLGSQVLLSLEHVCALLFELMEIKLHHKWR